MNRESTSRQHIGRGIHDGAETSCKQQQHALFDSLCQYWNARGMKSDKPVENVLDKANYGRRRTESAPDALLDCLHCGKDLHDLREERGAQAPKKRHSRRYTVASEAPVCRKHTSPPRSLCAPHQRRKKCQVCERNYEEETRRKEKICAATSRQSPKGNRCRCGGDQATSYEHAENSVKRIDCKHLNEKKCVPRRNKQAWLRTTNSFPRAVTADDSSDEDFLSPYQNNPRSVVFGPQSPKCKGDNSEDAIYSDETDSETELININENRRRKSQTSLTRNPQREVDKEGIKRKARQRRYSKKYSCPTRLHQNHHHHHLHHGDSQKEEIKKGPYNGMCGSTAGPSEKNHPQLSTSDEEDANQGPQHASTTGHPAASDNLLIAKLSDMLRRHRLCDVTLRSNGQEVPAHKLALAAFSDTFARTYCQGDTGHVVIDVPDSSVGGIQEVLRFLYSGDIRLTADNVGNVLAAAAFLRIDHIVNLCKQIILNPDVETIIPFSSLAEKYRLTEDLTPFYDFTCKHFIRVSRTRGWKTLTFSQVFDLLSENNLHVDRELDVFHAAVSWIDADRANRLTFAADLIGCVRFAYISPDEIAKHVESKQFLFQGDEGKELLLCIYRHHALQTCGCAQHGHRGHHLPRRQYVALEARTSAQQNISNSNCSPPRHRLVLPPPSTPSSSHPPHYHHSPSVNTTSAPLTPLTSDVILAVGGVNPFRPDVEEQARLVQQFHPRQNRWTTVTRLPDGRHHHGVVMLRGCLYIIGGSILDDLNPDHLCNPCASCYRYEVSSGQWSAIAPLGVARMYHATAILNDVIFVVAGQTLQARPLSSMECYRPEVGEWEGGVGLCEGRIGVAVAGHRGQLFAAGGFLQTQQEHVVRDTVEVFNPRTGCWSRLKGLPSPRCHAGLAECGDRLYLVGGSTFPAHSASVCSLPSLLRYDDNDDRWDRIQTLRIPRHDMGLAVLGTRIFVIGGVSSEDNKVLNDVECYDVETNYWLDDVDPIRSPALGLVCVTLLIDQ